MNYLKPFIVAIALFLGVAPFSFAATVLLTNSSDTLNTFRTNVNTSLTNLNTAGGSSIATSSNPVANQLAQWTGTGYPATLGGIATSSLNIAISDTTGTLTVPRGGTGLSALTGNSLLYTNSSGSALVFTATSSLNIGGNAANVTGTVAITNGGTGVTSLTADSLLYTNHAGTGVAAAATSSISVSTGFSSSGTFGAQVGGTPLVLKKAENRCFSVSTTTAWTGTTTQALGIGYGETWSSIKGWTDTGTLNVDFYHASSHISPLMNASTTVGTTTMTANTTDTFGDKVQVDIGTPASSPTKITLCVQDTI